jgi:hypothetical protein
MFRSAGSSFTDTARSTERSAPSANRQLFVGADTEIAQRGGARSAVATPCLRQYGYFSNATLVGRHWITAKGLRLGDPARKLHLLYSPRRFTGSWA